MSKRVGQEGASVVLEGREKMLFQVRTPSPPFASIILEERGGGGCPAQGFSLFKASFSSKALDCNRCDVNKVELNFTFSSHLHMLEAGIHLRRWV